MTESNNRDNRVFLDTMILAEMESPLDKLTRLTGKGYILVIPNTVVDVRCFQEKPNWLRMQLKRGTLLIQKFMEADDMVRKAFMWSSCGETTQPAECFEDAIENLPNWEGIMQVKELMDKYALSKEEWKPGQWAAPEPLSEEHKAILGVPDGATRTDILARCRATGHMDIFEQYNVGYNRGLATQHHCKYLLTITGDVTEL